MNSALRILIANRRRERGITYEGLAAVAACSATELRGFELGLLSLNPALLATLIRALGISADELAPVMGPGAVPPFDFDIDELKKEIDRRLPKKP